MFPLSFPQGLETACSYKSILIALGLNAPIGTSFTKTEDNHAGSNPITPLTKPSRGGDRQQDDVVVT
jgi:hypothetical protein